MESVITIGSSNRTIVIDMTHHWHQEFDPLYAGENYEKEVGMVCVDCAAQFFWTDPVITGKAMEDGR